MEAAAERSYPAPQLRRQPPKESSRPQPSPVTVGLKVACEWQSNGKVYTIAAVRRRVSFDTNALPAIILPIGMGSAHRYPALHNAMWPGLVGKGPDSEPPIGLDEMLDLTAAAEIENTKFDGVDLFLADPHTSIDSSSDDIKRLADKIAAKNLEVGS